MSLLTNYDQLITSYLFWMLWTCRSILRSSRPWWFLPWDVQTLVLWTWQLPNLPQQPQRLQTGKRKLFWVLSSKCTGHLVVPEVVLPGGETGGPDTDIEDDLSVQFDDGDVIVLGPLVVLPVFGHVDDVEGLRTGLVLVLLEVVLSKNDRAELVVDTVGGRDDVPGGDESPATLDLAVRVGEGCDPGVGVEPGGDPTHHPELSDPWHSLSTLGRQSRTLLSSTLPLLPLPSPAGPPPATGRRRVTPPGPGLGSSSAGGGAGGPALPGAPASWYDWSRSSQSEKGDLSTHHTDPRYSWPPGLSLPDTGLCPVLCSTSSSSCSLPRTWLSRSWWRSRRSSQSSPAPLAPRDSRRAGHHLQQLVTWLSSHFSSPPENLHTDLLR